MNRLHLTGIWLLVVLFFSSFGMSLVADERGAMHIGAVAEVRENQLVLSVEGGDSLVFDVAADTMILVQNREAALGDVKPGFQATVMAVEEKGRATATMIDAQMQL